jgi:hypothetical protein
MTVKKPDAPPFGRTPTGGMEGWVVYDSELLAEKEAIRLAEKKEAEAEKKKAVAEAATKAMSDQGSLGGVASGVKRRDEAEQTWQPHALSLAIEIQAKDQGIVQISLKKEIESRWRLKIPCPKSQLIKAISRWQREGKLARRNKL